MIEDEEIKNILNRERHKRWLNLSMALYDIEEELENIKEFWYNSTDNSITIKTKEGYLRYHIGEE